MPRPKPWLKMWVSWVDDPTILRLPLAEQAAWCRVYTLARKLGDDGRLVTNGGSPLTIDEIADNLHLNKAPARAALESMFQKMQDERYIAVDGGAYLIVNFREEQETAPSETREAAAERQRAHREKLAREKAALEGAAQGSLPLVTPSTTDTKERKEENRGERHDPKLVTPQADARFGALCTAYESNGFGMLTPLASDNLKDFLNEYKGPPEWIEMAMREAVAQSKRGWRYVEAILRRWQADGGPGKKITGKEEGNGAKGTRTATRGQGAHRLVDRGSYTPPA